MYKRETTDTAGHHSWWKWEQFDHENSLMFLTALKERPAFVQLEKKESC